MSNKKSKRKTIIQVAVRIAFLPALLFLPAGTLNRPEAWLFLIIWVSSSGANPVWFMRMNSYPEDKALQKELPGYDEYVNRVCYRLLPGVW